MVLSDLDPSRDIFHISEAIAHTAMLGHYLLATGRFEAAKVQLELLAQIAPENNAYHRLAGAITLKVLKKLAQKGPRQRKDRKTPR